MRVEDLSEGKHANHLVERVSSMNELVASKTVDACHVAPDEGEDQPVEHRVAVPVFE